MGILVTNSNKSVKADMEPLILAETLCDFPLEFAQTFKFGEIVQLDILGSK